MSSLSHLRAQLAEGSTDEVCEIDGYHEAVFRNQLSICRWPPFVSVTSLRASHSLSTAALSRLALASDGVMLLRQAATFCSFLAALASATLPLAWAIFAAASVFSIVTTQLATRALRGYPFAARWSWLIPVRDIVFFFVWLRGMTMQSVNWRGNSLLVLKGTELKGFKK